MPFDVASMLQHPLSAAYPAMSTDDFNALATDIKLHGLREPISVFEGQILDGWHRYNACLVSEIAPEFVEFDEGDPREFVISKNGHRRHLTASQRAAAIIKTMEWRPRGNQPEAIRTSADRPSAEQMAKVAHVGTRTIEQAKAAESAGFGDLVRDGKVSAKQAAEIAKESPKVQAQAKAAIEKGEAPKLPEKARPISELEKLQIENEELKESLAEMARDLEAYMKVEAADGKVDSTIQDMLRQQRAIESQRDSLMRENAELKKEVKRLQRKLGMKA
jgi:hypothetical protein